MFSNISALLAMLIESDALKTEWWDAGVVVCLGRGADLHMAQLMPLPLTITCFSKYRLVSSFWYELTWVVLNKGLLNGCCCCYIGLGQLLLSLESKI